MSNNPFIEGEAIREMAGPVKPKRQPYLVSGSRDLVTQGIASLEKMSEQFDFQGWDESLELAEFKLWENSEIEAILCDDTGSHTYVWDGEQWIEAS